MGEEPSEDDLAAACLALDFSSLFQDVAEANKLLTSTIAAEKGRLWWPPIAAKKALGNTRRGAVAPGTSAAIAADLSPAAVSNRQKQQGSCDQRLHGKSNIAAADTAAATADAASAAAAAAAAAALEAKYKAALQPLQFVEADLMGGGHYFKKEAQALAAKAAGGEASVCRPLPATCLSDIVIAAASRV
jgi:hypothetical protein